MTTLKKCLLAAFVLVVVCLNAGNSQAQTLKEFFNDGTIPLTYLGVDFSAVKVEGETATAAEMISKFEPINTVITTETKKYDIAGAFKRSKVSNYLDAVQALNEKVNPSSLKVNGVADLEKGLTPTDVEKHVKKYDLHGQKGIGLVFIMEGMSKTNKEAYVYATLIDLADKKVLLTERFGAKAQGFGFRNYWAYTIYKVLNSIDHGKYKEWKNKSATTAEIKVAAVKSQASLM